MAFRAIRVAMLLASLPLAGCGTVANLAQSHPEQGGRIPFGGVHHDVQCIHQAANGEAGSRTQPTPASEQRQGARMLFWGADLPLSFIGDVVTWPYTATFTYINQPVFVPPVMQPPPPPVTP